MLSNTDVRTVRFTRYLEKSINAAELVDAPELALAANKLITPRSTKSA